MPSYSKSKSTTIARGINKVLCIKKLKHYFIPCKINNTERWRYVFKRWLEMDLVEDEYIPLKDYFNLG